MELLFGNRLRGKIRVFQPAKASPAYLCVFFFKTNFIS
jgi:hypothetical protein